MFSINLDDVEYSVDKAIEGTIKETKDDKYRRGMDIIRALKDLDTGLGIMWEREFNKRIQLVED